MTRLLLTLLLLSAPAGRLTDRDYDLIQCKSDTDCESREVRGAEHAAEVQS